MSAHKSIIPTDAHHVGYIVPRFVHIFLMFQFWFHVFLFHMEEGNSAVTKEADGNILWVEILALAISLS